MSIEEIAQHRVMVLPETGEYVTTPDGMAELIGSLWGQSVTLVAVPRERLDPEFFRLASGVAGEFLQKLVNYRTPVAIIGNIDAETAASAPLRDFVWESNRGTQVWFEPTLDALRERLRG
ncbi:DUF4180 domain-containing protein [Mycetocola sp. JXN-3]|uniref:DUF4180 domain-containing protein n=1 Tax=Mycetocola sp. JXN-3 TaxID=2116510 RepID=UPI00165D247B|nr:DUF4180 domain-containing protein [Mycetocola sp. JXN-3]